MKSGHHEESKNSSEEIDQPEQANDDASTGRSYECVFCKRGFTTAQALGGHMNIHRKDRARARPRSVPSAANKLKQDFATPRFYPSDYPVAPKAQVNYQVYFPGSTSGARPSHARHTTDDSHVRNPQRLYPFVEDWRTSLSLHIGAAHVEDIEKKRQGSSEEDELDLELRLGHNP